MKRRCVNEAALKCHIICIPLLHLVRACFSAMEDRRTCDRRDKTLDWAGIFRLKIREFVAVPRRLDASRAVPLSPNSFFLCFSLGFLLSLASIPDTESKKREAKRNYSNNSLCSFRCFSSVPLIAFELLICVYALSNVTRFRFVARSFDYRLSEFDWRPLLERPRVNCERHKPINENNLLLAACRRADWLASTATLDYFAAPHR